MAGPRLFAAGGMGEYRERTIVGEYFDMQREVFREIPPLLEPRCCGGGGVAGDLLILAGGFYGVAENLCFTGFDAYQKVMALPEVNDVLLGSKGTARVALFGGWAVQPKGGPMGRYRDPNNNPYHQEHTEFIASIREGRALNEPGKSLNRR